MTSSRRRCTERLPPEFRHVEHAYLSQLLARKAPRELLRQPDIGFKMALSADGKRFAWSTKDHAIRVWDLEAGKEGLLLAAIKVS